MLKRHCFDFESKSIDSVRSCYEESCVGVLALLGPKHDAIVRLTGYRHDGAVAHLKEGRCIIGDQRCNDGARQFPSREPKRGRLGFELCADGLQPLDCGLARDVFDPTTQSNELSDLIDQSPAGDLRSKLGAAAATRTIRTRQQEKAAVAVTDFTDVAIVLTGRVRPLVRRSLNRCREVAPHC